MAQTAVANALRRALLPHLHIPDLDSQVRSGHIVVADADLHEIVLPGLRCSGHVESLSATWSWRSLLSSPASVEISGLSVFVDILDDVDGEEVSPSSLGDVDDPSDPQSQSFVKRLKNRIWDTLRLRVSRLHIRVAAPARSGGVDRRRALLGAVVDELAVTPDAARSGQGALRQSVGITNAGLYAVFSPAAPSRPPRTASPPPAPGFIFRGLCPQCEAVRTSGRRFVDLRGVSVQVNLGEPVISVTKEQYDCVRDVIAALNRPGGPCPPAGFSTPNRCSAGASPASRCSAASPASRLWRAASPAAHRGSGHGSGDVGEQRRPSLRSRLPFANARWWPGRRRSSEASPSPSPPPPSLPESFLACVSTEDRARLLAEESPPSSGATFELRIRLGQAMLALDELALRGVLQGRLSISYRRDGWLAGLQVACLSLVDHAPSTAAAGARALEVCRASGTDEAPAIDLSFSSVQQLSMKLKTTGMSMTLSKTMVQTLCWLAYSALQSTALQNNRKALRDAVVKGSSKLAATWSLGDMEVVVGEPWFFDGRLAFTANMHGQLEESGKLSSKVGARLDVDDDQGRRAMVPDCTWHVERSEGGKVVTRCSALVVRCDLQKFISIWHFVCSNSDGGFAKTDRTSEAHNLASRVSWELHVDKAIVQMRDGCAECLITAQKLTCSVSAQRSSITTDGVNFDFARGTGMSGSLRLSEFAAWWAALPQSNFGVISSAEVLDAVGHVALRCAALRVTTARPSPAAAVGEDELQPWRLRVVPHDIELDTSEAFVVECRRLVTYFSALSDALAVRRFVFDDRPLGLEISGGRVASVSGLAARRGVLAGSKIAAVEPAPGCTDLESHVASCPLPVALLLLPPSRLLQLDVSIAQFSLHAIRFDTQRALGMVVERADIAFDEFLEPSWRGSAEDLQKRLGTFYSQVLRDQMPSLLTAASIGGSSLVSSALGVALHGGYGLMGVAASAARDAATAGSYLKNEVLAAAGASIAEVVAPQRLSQEMLGLAQLRYSSGFT